MIRPPPRPTLFPSPTLFRSAAEVSRSSRHSQCDKFACSVRGKARRACRRASSAGAYGRRADGLCLEHRSEEHTSELQSPCNLVSRLLLEKKKEKNPPHELGE